jgi:hypothetical protein
MADKDQNQEQQKKKLPPLRKKGRAPAPDSLAAALHWDKIHKTVSDQAAEKPEETRKQEES